MDWIRIEKKKPPEDESVLVWNGSCEIAMYTSWNGRRGFFNPDLRCGFIEHVTYWMYLPADPKLK